MAQALNRLVTKPLRIDESQGIVHPAGNFLFRNPQVTQAKGDIAVDIGIENLLVRVLKNGRESDIEVTKRQWGAFYGTDLELQLRRRGIDTIILCGISTNIGVESTARNAWELGFNLILVEDACSAATAEQHQGSMTHIFPRIARVRSTEEVLAAL